MDTQTRRLRTIRQLRSLGLSRAAGGCNVPVRRTAKRPAYAQSIRIFMPGVRLQLARRVAVSLVRKTIPTTL